MDYMFFQFTLYYRKQRKMFREKKKKLRFECSLTYQGKYVDT